MIIKCSKIFISFICAFLIFSIELYAVESLPRDLETVGVEEKIDHVIPLDTLVTDSTGKTVPLARILSGDKPVLLSLVYYNCPMLCHLILDGLSQSFQEMKPAFLDDFIAVSLSFDPEDTPEMAAKFKARYTEDRPVDWRFLVAAPEAIRAITAAVGFQYRYIPETGEFAHGSALVALSPTGRIQRYLYGIEYDPFDIRMALLDSGQAASRSVIDEFLLFCYTYDSDANSYVLQAWAVMRLAGVATVFIMGGIIGYLFYSGRRKT